MSDYLHLRGGAIFVMNFYGKKNHPAALCGNHRRTTMTAKRFQVRAYRTGTRLMVSVDTVMHSSITQSTSNATNAHVCFPSTSHTNCKTPEKNHSLVSYAECRSSETTLCFDTADSNIKRIYAKLPNH